jgi:hypothetical protein
MLSVKEVRVDYLTIERTTEGVKVSGTYRVLLASGKVLATVPFNGYSETKVAQPEEILMNAKNLLDWHTSRINGGDQ